MITRIAKPSSSSSDPLNYNEEKLFAGEAQIVAVRNIREATMFRIRLEMERLEANPLIHANTKNKGFHLSVNPTIEDNMNDADVVNYVDDMMTDLKYGDQPYVVFRHNDIDRVHYHVVSTNVDENGRIIRDSFSRLKVMRLQEKYSSKYGFSVSVIENDAEKLEPTPLKTGMKNMIGFIRANVHAAVNFIHKGDTQLKAVLRYYGILLRRGISKKGHPYESFRGVDEDGNYLGRPIPVKKVLGESFDSYYQNHYLEHKYGKKDFSISKIRIAFEQSKDGNIDDFRRRLNKRGISLYLSNKNGNEAQKKADIEDVVFIDTNANLCLSLADCRLKLNDVIRLIRESDAEKKKNGVSKNNANVIKIH